jgi:hypothetical protein
MVDIEAKYLCFIYAKHFRITSVNSSAPEVEGWHVLSSSGNYSRPSLNLFMPFKRLL